MLILTAGPVSGQENLLRNPGFDDSLSEWENLNDRVALWDSEDHSGVVNSGSARVGNIGTSNGGVPVVLSQCVRLQAQREYVFGGRSRVLAGQPVDSKTFIFVSAFIGPNCSGDSAYDRSFEANSNDTTSWSESTASFVNLADAQSARLGFGVFKPNGVSSDALALFDELYIRPTSEDHQIGQYTSGAWYDPRTAGQGFFFDVVPTINLFFAGWFTWTGVAGEYDWYTLQGGYLGNTATTVIYRTSGGRFNEPIPTITTAIGTAEFVFSTCAIAQARILFDGASPALVIPLVRIAPAPPTCAER